MLKLDGSGLVVRFFEACLRVWDAFTGEGSDYWDSQRTNICHFTRTIIVAAPFAILCNAAFYGLVILVFVGWPVANFGWTIYGVIVGAIVAAVGSCLLIWWIADRWPRYPEKAEKPKKPKRRRVIGPAIGEFALVIWAWIMAVKHRFCPLIEVTK